MALRKKYDELVSFTVQLTGQRDVLLTDLEKTYPFVHDRLLVACCIYASPLPVALIAFLDRSCFAVEYSPALAEG